MLNKYILPQVKIEILVVKYSVFVSIYSFNIYLVNIKNINQLLNIFIFLVQIHQKPLSSVL